VIEALGRVAAGARRIGLGGIAASLVRSTDAAALRLALRPPLGTTVEGTVIRGYLRHRSFLAEASRPDGTYVGLFTRLLRSGMTVVDGGAHIGLYTALAAQTVGTDDLVLAVEPDRYNLAALRANVARFTNVRIVPEALADRIGTATFYETPSTIGSSLLQRERARPATVQTTTIDSLLSDRLPTSLLVKLNIEGAEPLAIVGMAKTLDAVERVTIIMEVNPPLIAAAGTDLDALLESLRQRGFTIERIDFGSQQPVPLPPTLGKCHLLASRNARP
jgi:FkbM family methyltransferase